MFVDEVDVTFKAGKGGDGMVSWRREAYIPKGGPYGGNWGNGGDIILVTDPNINTLSEFRYKKVVSADNGVPGGTKVMNGANAEHLIVKIPVGTLVKSEDQSTILVDLSTPGSSLRICQWGRGGYGNAHFVGPTRQTPRFAEIGDRGEEIKVHLELKLVADIGIIGLPSAGKSTLISTVTNARPKVAEYHFTTLVPNLGIMDHKGHSLVLEDVPGLIPGAHKGDGLGIQFLKHIQRTKVLAHLLDLSEYDKCLENYEAIKNELLLFDKSMGEKDEIIVLSKSDILGDQDMINEVKNMIQKAHPDKKIFTISAATHQGIDELKDYLINTYGYIQSEVAIVEQDIIDLREQPDPRRIDIQDMGEHAFEVSGMRLNQIVRMTDMTNYESIMRVYDVMGKMHVLRDIATILLEEHKKSYPDSSVDITEIFQYFPDGKVTIEWREFPFEKIMFL